MVTEQKFFEVLRKLGVKEGDSVLVHSSLKSLGEVERGVDAIISALRQAVGDGGTVVFPTLCQVDFEHSYETWHMGKESDVGYLTNYFWKLPGALRSNQATHSVAAMGEEAEYLTKTHGETGKRFGPFGDTPFSADSPWEKMYRMNTKVIFIGVTLNVCTFRHYAEYCYIERLLNQIKSRPDFEKWKGQLWSFEKFSELGPWPDISNQRMYDALKREGKVWEEFCGDAKITMVEAKTFVDKAWELLEKDPIQLVIDRQKEPFSKWLQDTGLDFVGKDDAIL